VSLGMTIDQNSHITLTYQQTTAEVAKVLHA
jgi:hypothetical protein